MPSRPAAAPASIRAAVAMLLVLTAPLAICALATTPLRATAAGTQTANAATGDAIFAVLDEGELAPVAVRIHGTFLNPGSTDNAPSAKLYAAANAALAANGNKVNVIFGGRYVARVSTKVKDGNASISVPATLHLSENVEALASPTLKGHANAPRRAPTPTERKDALTMAAKTLGMTSAASFEVRNLTAIDLGSGIAIVGTIFVDGTKTTHQDRHLFFIAERTGGTLHATLSHAQTTPSNTELSGVGEALIDAIDLGDGTLSIVTRISGADAHTYGIYSRTKSTWKNIYTGGGIAL